VSAVAAARFCPARLDSDSNPLILEMPAFPDIYQETHGKTPSVAKWDAPNWLTLQTGKLAFAHSRCLGQSLKC